MYRFVTFKTTFNTAPAEGNFLKVHAGGFTQDKDCRSAGDVPPVRGWSAGGLALAVRSQIQEPNECQSECCTTPSVVGY